MLRHQHLLYFITLLATAFCLSAQNISPQLPTDNDFLFRGQPEKFFMYCDRIFEGTVTKPWTAGQYGMVRTMKRTPHGVIATKFHEGIDISPVKRAANGVPQDTVRPILPGTVVYLSNAKGRSNYGLYVVIEHKLPEGCFYSLYAHLNRIDCQVGQQLTPNDTIGLLGFTGRGIDLTRAHVHLEWCLMVDAQYSNKLPAGSGPNYHGNFNGLNLCGLDVADLLLKSHQQNGINLSQYLSSLPCHYKITLPRAGHFEICQRYPYLIQGNHQVDSPSWEVAFTASGFPIYVKPSNREVTQACVSWVNPSPFAHQDLTSGKISGTGHSATLTSRGKSMIEKLLQTNHASSSL